MSEKINDLLNSGSLQAALREIYEEVKMIDFEAGNKSSEFSSLTHFNRILFSQMRESFYDKFRVGDFCHYQELSESVDLEISPLVTSDYLVEEDYDALDNDIILLTSHSHSIESMDLDLINYLDEIKHLSGEYHRYYSEESNKNIIIIKGYDEHGIANFNLIILNLLKSFSELEKSGNPSLEIFSPTIELTPHFLVNTEITNILVQAILEMTVEFMINHNITVNVNFAFDNDFLTESANNTIIRSLRELLDLSIHKKNGLRAVKSSKELSAINFSEEQTFIANKFLTSDPKFIGDIQTLIQSIRFKKNILILGETGVGKTILAKFIHSQSNRSNKEFLEVSAYSDSEIGVAKDLCGHKKGAFTGAISDQEGILSKANGGIIFLDEVHLIPERDLNFLIKIIETKKYAVLGAPNEIKDADVIFIFGTNFTTDELLNTGKIRYDLLTRMAQRMIKIKSLKERKEDMPKIIEYHEKKLNNEFNTELKIDEKSKSFITNYHWKGNLRDLDKILGLVFQTNAHKNIITVEDIKYVLLDYLLEGTKNTNNVKKLEEILKTFLEDWYNLIEKVPAPLKSKTREEKEKNFLESIIYPILANIYYDEINLDIPADTKNKTAIKIVGLAGGSRNESALQLARQIYPLLKKSLS